MQGGGHRMDRGISGKEKSLWVQGGGRGVWPPRLGEGEKGTSQPTPSVRA